MTTDISIGAQISCANAALDAGKTFQIFFFRPTDSASTQHLEQINQLCQRHGARLEVRFYGYYGTVFDAQVLRHLPAVQNLTINSLERIVNEDYIAALGQLKRFWFEVQSFDRPDFLSRMNLAHLERLQLMATAKSNLDLGPLAGARRLRELVVDKHQRNIECLGDLPLLEQLTLWSQSKKVSLEFVAKLRALRSLEFVMGGRDTLSDLSSNSLEYLTVWHVLGLRDIGSISRFRRLKGLAVQEQARLSTVDLKGASLTYLSVVECKSLSEIEGLDEQKALEFFSAVKTELPMDALRDRTWPESLRGLHLWSKKKKWNEETRARLDALGYERTGSSWFTSSLV